MTKDEGLRLAALVTFFVNGGYNLPSSIRTPSGTFRYTNYGSNSVELYAQEQQTSKVIRGVIAQPSFSVTYGSEEALEVQISSNQVYRVRDMINNAVYFPTLSGSQLSIDGNTFYKG